MCCRLQFCIGGFELKVGVWTLAMLEIILGSVYIIVEASESLKEVQWIKQSVHILIYVAAASSLIGGLLLIIGITRKNRVILIAGAVLGYPMAIPCCVSLLWQIYLTIVLCSFLDQIDQGIY